MIVNGGTASKPGGINVCMPGLTVPASKRKNPPDLVQIIEPNVPLYALVELESTSYWFVVEASLIIIPCAPAPTLSSEFVVTPK